MPITRRCFVLEKPLAIEAGQPLEVKLFHGANANYLVGRFAIDLIDDNADEAGRRSMSRCSPRCASTEKRTPEQAKLVSEAFTTVAGGRPRRAWRPRRNWTIRHGRSDGLEGAGPSRARRLSICVATSCGRIRKSARSCRTCSTRCRRKLPPAEKRTRLDLAQWLVNPENPLTPRVTMNRVWMHYFGRGLVETEEDFGTQGTLPVASRVARLARRRIHPPRLVAEGNAPADRDEQHVPAVVELSRRTLNDKDPRNLLLARQERLRFEAEDRPRRGSLGQRPLGPHDRRPERQAAAAGRRLCLHADRRRSGRPTRALPATAGRCTRCFSAALRIRCSRRSTRPIFKPSAPAAAAATRRCRRSPSPTTPRFSNSRRDLPPA